MQLKSANNDQPASNPVTAPAFPFSLSQQETMELILIPKIKSILIMKLIFRSYFYKLKENIGIILNAINYKNRQHNITTFVFWYGFG